MESTRIEKLPPPPGIISSIKAGFDAIAARISVIFLPLVLDLFLWLGPRLRVNVFFDILFKDRLWTAPAGMPPPDPQQILDFEKLISSINLFWVFRTFPVGISSLIFPQEITRTPLGEPAVFQAGIWNFLIWVLLLTLTGWIAGGLYFRNVAWLVTSAENSRPVRVSHAILQTVLLSLVWSILMAFIGGPLVVMIAVLAQLNVVLANIAVVFLSVVSMWVIVPLFFWPHGVFIRSQNFISSIISSVQMARFTLPTSSMFILTIFLLSMGLNYLWNAPGKDSWMTLIGIFGHAFVSTALLAGSFIYYRDMNAWLQNVIERLKSNAPRQA